jgi:hypothetical protein
MKDTLWCLSEWMVPYVPQNCGAFIFKRKMSKDFKMSEDTDPGTQCHIVTIRLSLNLILGAKIYTLDREDRVS